MLLISRYIRKRIMIVCFNNTFSTSKYYDISVVRQKPPYVWMVEQVLLLHI
jgi:hypothetical protein